MRTDSQILLDGVQKSCSRQGRCFKTSLCFRFSWCYSCWCCLALLAICFQCCEWSFFLSFSHGWLRLLDILNQSAKIPLNLKIGSEILPALCLITNAICPCYVAVWWCLDLVNHLTLFRAIPTLNIPLECKMSCWYMLLIKESFSLVMMQGC